MIISATPYRISFFGGGTDYPVWFQEHGGAVLATTINKYCYITCRTLPPFFEYRHRIVWSRVEHVNEVDDIVHPAVREAIRYMNVQQGLEIHHDGDLPARSGLGSSSSFSVGILHALRALDGKMTSKSELAQLAIHLEQHLLKEDVGIQDQIMTAYGGLNVVEFDPDSEFRVNPIPIDPLRKELFQHHLMLIYTGISRTASEVAKSQIESIPRKKEVMRDILDMVPEATKILAGTGDISEFGRLLHEAWLLKKSITERISTSLVDDMYERARNAGALGGKLLGAGGGGFIVFFVEPGLHQSVLEALEDFLLVPFELENSGSHIALYEPKHFSKYALANRHFTR
ncbi:MAG: kinase [Pseudomonadota bacterium]|nr:kinase [Alphaproteobacteria bacterium]MEC8370938.1 kinase [Pseudomonadota bacterium]